MAHKVFARAPEAGSREPDRVQFVESWTQRGTMYSVAKWFYVTMVWMVLPILALATWVFGVYRPLWLASVFFLVFGWQPLMRWLFRPIPVANALDGEAEPNQPREER